MKVLFLAVLTCALTLVTSGVASAGTAARAATGQVVVIQAAPGMAVNLTIDGKMMTKGAREGAELGPFQLAAGTHDVTFEQSSGGTPIRASLAVKAGSNSDVVLHFPAVPGGKPVVNSYHTPVTAIGPGKARLLVAHTATVAPADVQFDGKTVFRDIANGEYAQAEVPDGTHEVALLPTGVTSKPLLGPLDVTLQQRTVTMVYAVGSPADGSMNVIKHTVHVSSNGAVAPDRIKTGSAGLAGDVSVTPFSVSKGFAARTPATRALRSWLPVVLLRMVQVGAATSVR